MSSEELQGPLETSGPGLGWQACLGCLGQAAHGALGSALSTSLSDEVVLDFLLPFVFATSVIIQ